VSTLSEELAADQASSQCRICAWLETQSPESQGEWRTELSRPAKVISHTSVLRALKKRGVATSETSVKRHRSLHA